MEFSTFGVDTFGLLIQSIDTPSIASFSIRRYKAEDAKPENIIKCFQPNYTMVSQCLSHFLKAIIIPLLSLYTSLPLFWAVNLFLFSATA
jgi:hypothetical protein